MIKEIEHPEIPPFEDLLRERDIAEGYIGDKWAFLEIVGWVDWFNKEYQRESNSDSEASYPSQGLARTDYDGQLIESAKEVKLEREIFQRTAHVWLYYLELFNHPDRLSGLYQVDQEAFIPPEKSPDSRAERIFQRAYDTGRAVSINELALSPQGDESQRTKRTERFRQGPFVKLGRQARAILVGSANPDCWGGAPAVASMAMAHCLAGLPRDGLFTDINRQADFAKKVFEWLEFNPVLYRLDERKSQRLLEYTKRNVYGVLEANPEKAVKRAEALYEEGVRSFRIYSPEPGNGPVETLKALRGRERLDNWESIEISGGQMISVRQVKEFEQEGGNMVVLGIAGGGRCITGVRAGLAIDWPELLWRLRGETSLPIIVEGGASDNIAQTLAVGATGIGVSRAVAGGTIESPGGYLYLTNGDGELFVPYGGEASARIKSLGGRIGPYGIVPYVEGETDVAYMEYGRGDAPTELQKLFFLFGDTVVSFVFQNADGISDFQQKAVNSLKRASLAENNLRRSH